MLKPVNARIERGLWSGEEHDRFLDGLKLFPRGPWKKIASHVGTRSPRQVQTHAQKYYEKVGRRLRGLRKDRKKLVRPEHRLDEDMVQLCQLAKQDGGRVDPQLASRLRAPLSSPGKLLAATTDKSHALASFQEQLQSVQTVPASPCPSAGSCSSGGASDTDSNVDLSDFDNSCLDFLIEVLSGGVEPSTSQNTAVSMTSACDFVVNV